MITTILRNTTRKQLHAAYHYTADREQGGYLSWDGFIEMLEADAR